MLLHISHYLGYSGGLWFTLRWMRARICSIISDTASRFNMVGYKHLIIILAALCCYYFLAVRWNMLTLQDVTKPVTLERDNFTQSGLRLKDITQSVSSTTKPPLNPAKHIDKYRYIDDIEANNFDITQLVNPFMTGCSNGSRSQPIRILLWPGRKNWHCMGNAKFECHIGGGKSCVLATNPKSFHKSSVIIVDAHEPKLTPFDFLQNRSHHQRLVYHQHEAPYIAWLDSRRSRYEFTHAFNLTSTFAFDSDVPFWTEEEVILQINRTKQVELEFAKINYAANKTRMVSWFVSNCKTQSQREAYVTELQKFISVDIMGNCGNKSMGCGARMQYDDCDSVFLSKYYKFYLSFENSICQDYITEKLWRIIANKKANVIPIVLGGANYSKLLPPKTYIDVKDFDSPEELSKFLSTINDNDDMYNEYIRNKKAIIQKPLPFMFGSKSATYASRLCRYLHATGDQVSSIGTHGDVQEYWNKTKMCQTLSQLSNQVPSSP